MTHDIPTEVAEELVSFVRTAADLRNYSGNSHPGRVYDHAKELAAKLTPVDPDIEEARKVHAAWCDIPESYNVIDYGAMCIKRGKELA